MKTTHIIPTLALAALIGGCSDSSNAALNEAAAKLRTEASEALDALKDYAALKKDDLIVKLQEGVEILNERVAVLKDKAEESGAAGKAKLVELLADLNAKRELLQEKINALKGPTSEALDDLKQGAVEAYGELDKAVRSAADQYK